MEVLNHEELQELLQQQPANEIEIRLAQIASYCGVVLDGVYSDSDLVRLCGILNKALIKKRTGIAIISGVAQ